MKKRKGRPTPLVKLESKDRVAFSRWCKRRILSLQTLGPMELQEVKASWMINPEAARSRILNSSSGQKSTTMNKDKDHWYTAAKIASAECLHPDSAELQALLAGLKRKKSRYSHLKDQEAFDEYEYHDFHSKIKAKEKFVETPCQPGD